jgi:hypothetical protein
MAAFAQVVISLAGLTNSACLHRPSLGARSAAEHRRHCLTFRVVGVGVLCGDVSGNVRAAFTASATMTVY